MIVRVVTQMLGTCKCGHRLDSLQTFHVILVFFSFKSSAKYVVVVLYNISTLGIPSLYRRHYGNLPRSFTGEMNTLGPPCDTTIGDFDQLPLHNPIPYDPYTEQLWRETFNQIEAGWKTLLAVPSSAVLGCVSFDLDEIC